MLGLSDRTGIRITAGLFLASCLFVLILTMRTDRRNEVLSTDENGVTYLRNKTRDAAVWMDRKDIPKVFYVGDVSKTDATIYGQLSDQGKQVVAWKPKRNGGEGTRNDLVLATMGAGKTYTYVMNELIQTVRRGDSFIASDPKNELFRELALYCQDNGYDVHVLNTAEPKYSEFWNCLQETIDPETERLDGTRLNEFVDIYMQNSAGGAGDFWYESALNLVKAVIGFVAWKREAEVTDGYADLYRQVDGAGVNDPVVYKIRNTLCPFPWVRQTILTAAAKRGLDTDEIESLMHDIQHELPRTDFSIGTVVDTLLSFNEVTDEMDMIPLWHPASFAYRMYRTNDTDTVRKSALQGAQMKFALFSDFTLKEVLSHDGIRIPEVNKKKSAYFIIMSDKTDTMKPIVSLFFSFFFKDVMDNYDREEQKAREQGTANPCLPVTAMLEEFFSIGVIAGSPEAFGKIMSTCRSRKVYIKVIIQYYKQLEELYGRNIKDAIQGGCSTLLYLGGNDPGTFEFISKYAGSATVMTESHRDSRREPGANLSETVRPLVTESEARLWKDRVLLIRQGEFPLRILPFPWTDHPVYRTGQIRPVSIYSFIEPVSVRTGRLKDKRRKPEHEIYERIRSYGQDVPEAVPLGELFDLGQPDAAMPWGIAKKKPRSGRKKRQESELNWPISLR